MAEEEETQESHHLPEFSWEERCLHLLTDSNLEKGLSASPSPFSHFLTPPCIFQIFTVKFQILRSWNGQKREGRSTEFDVWVDRWRSRKWSSSFKTQSDENQLSDVSVLSSSRSLNFRPQNFNIFSLYLLWFLGSWVSCVPKVYYFFPFLWLNLLPFLGSI